MTSLFAKAQRTKLRALADEMNRTGRQGDAERIHAILD